MEKLKSLIPEDLLQTVKTSSVDDLLSSCSSLLRLFLGLPQFHQVRTVSRNLLFSVFLSPIGVLTAPPFFGFLGLPFQTVSELADPDLGCCGKNEATSLDLKRSGNLCFRSRDFDDALRFYSKALRVAPPDAFDGDKILLASLFLNRANALHVFLSFSLLPSFIIESFFSFFFLCSFSHVCSVSCLRILGYSKRACGTAIVLSGLILIMPRFFAY